MHVVLNLLLILGQLKPVRLNFLEINIYSLLDPTIYTHKLILHSFLKLTLLQLFAN
jgi:hypothetical protein